jgi:hypothetical protein
MMIGYDIYDRFTMKHFRLHQRMTLTTKIYCSRLYIFLFSNFLIFIVESMLLYLNTYIFRSMVVQFL